MRCVLYHNPRCSKSREALNLLQSQGITPEIVHYLEVPPSPTELKRILKKLGLSARELARTKEALWRELGLEAPGLTDADVIEALAKNPSLIERPMFIAGARAVIGRPPERVLELL